MTTTYSTPFEALRQQIQRIERNQQVIAEELGIAWILELEFNGPEIDDLLGFDEIEPGDLGESVPPRIVA